MPSWASPQGPVQCRPRSHSHWVGSLVINTAECGPLLRWHIPQGQASSVPLLLPPPPKHPNLRLPKACKHPVNRLCVQADPCGQISLNI